MTIISWNINGIRAIVKKDFFIHLKKLKPDMLCLQETKAQDNEVLKALAPLSKYHLYINSATKKGYAGTIILSKIKPISVSHNIGFDTHNNEGRIICAEYPNFYLINVYVPNSGQHLERLNYRQQWDADFTTYIKTLKGVKPVIIAGDFNVAHRAIDVKNDKNNYNKIAGYTQTEIDGFSTLLDEDLIDSYRYLHPNKIAYTYWSYKHKARERNIGWRIDYALLSKVLAKHVICADVLSQYYGSDHCPIILKIAL